MLSSAVQATRGDPAISRRSGAVLEFLNMHDIPAGADAHGIAAEPDLLAERLWPAPAVLEYPDGALPGTPGRALLLRSRRAARARR